MAWILLLMDSDLFRAIPGQAQWDAWRYGILIRGERMSPGTIAGGKKTTLSSGGSRRPMGVDIGTANIVVYANGHGHAEAKMEANAFFTVPALPNTRKILESKAVRFFENDDRLHVIGNAAEEFARILGGTTRRPMQRGLVNLKESDSIRVIQAILDPMIPPPVEKGRTLWFSVPGNPVDQPGAVIFNESIFKTYLKGRGYVPRAINEAMAVVGSELADQHATGIGISMGGGMCDVCFSYLSIPAVTFSIPKGGDFIDQTVGGSVGESATKIKAMVGGTDYGRTQFNRATQALRQPGSAFKPFVYLTVLQKGLQPDSRIQDLPVAVSVNHGRQTWRPRNYTGRFSGEVTLKEALARSLNAATVRLALQVGLKDIIETARRVGINSKVIDKGAATIWDPGLPQADILPPATVAAIREMLASVVSDGTARRARSLGRTVYGKTGTTNHNAHALFVGFDASLVVGVWVGRDDRRPSGPRETGSRAALPIWVEFMQAVPAAGMRMAAVDMR